MQDFEFGEIFNFTQAEQDIYSPLILNPPAAGERD
jgi:hypothetical protein